MEQERNRSIKKELDALIKTMQQSTKRNATGETIGELLKAVNSNKKKDAESEAMKADLIMKLTNQQRVIDDTNATQGAVNLAQRNVAVLQQLIEEQARNAQPEEDRREANKMSNKILAATKGMSDGIKSLEKGIGDAMSTAGKGLGIAGLIMLFADPKKLIEYITKTFNFISDFVGDFYNVILGKKDFLDAVGNNLTLSLLAGGAILLKIGLVFASIVTKGAALFSAVSTMAASLMATYGSVLGIVKHFAKVGLVVGLIVIAVISLFKAVKEAFAVFEETGSKMEAFKALISTFFSNLIGIPANLIKDMIGFVAGMLGFENIEKELDDLDIVKVLKDTIEGMFKWISGVFDDIIGSVRSVLGPGIGGFNDEEQEAYDKRKRGREIESLEKKMENAPETARNTRRGPATETKADIKKKLDALYEEQGIEAPLKVKKMDDNDASETVKKFRADKVENLNQKVAEGASLSGSESAFLDRNAESARRSEIPARLSSKSPLENLKSEQDVSNAISARKEATNMTVASGGSNTSVTNNNTVNNTNISNDTSADTLTRGLYAPIAY